MMRLLKRRFPMLTLPAWSGGVATPWYLQGGVPLANAIAAFQPIGAASLAASYDNIASAATTWDCTAPVAAPTFDAATGWTINGSTQFLQVGSGAIVSGVPLSMVALINPNNVTDSTTVMCVTRTTANHFFNLMVLGAGVGDPIRAQAYDATAGNADTTAGYTAAAWHVIAGVYSTTSARAAYLNGANKGTDTTAVTPAGLNITQIGVGYWNTAKISYFAGKIAACAFYNIALDDAQVAAISAAMAALVA